MTPVMQSKLYLPDGIHSGNCFAACLASLLDLPLWMIPPFEEMFVRHCWADRRDEWLRRMFGLALERVTGHPTDSAEFYIANGRSARGVHHSVIYSRGALAHDPHPSGAGIEAVEWVWFLRPCS